jgi:hypothetical protein
VDVQHDDWAPPSTQSRQRCNVIQIEMMNRR